jgi:hypothetical protein
MYLIDKKADIRVGFFTMILFIYFNADFSSSLVRGVSALLPAQTCASAINFKSNLVMRRAIRAGN